jgi:hypothetical protein
MRTRHIFAAALFMLAGQAVAQTPIYKQANAPIEERVKDLLERMTPEEKVGQLCCPLGWRCSRRRNPQCFEARNISSGLAGIS